MKCFSILNLLAPAVALVLLLSPAAIADPPAPSIEKAERTAKAALLSHDAALGVLVSEVAKLGEGDVRALLLAFRKRAAAGDRPPQEEQRVGTRPSPWEREQTRQMVALLDDPDPDIVTEVVREFYVQPDLRATVALLSLLVRTQSSDLRTSINYSLERGRAIDAVPTLIGMLTHDDETSRRTADRALETIAGGEVRVTAWWAHDKARSAAAQRAHREWFLKNEAALRLELGQPRPGQPAKSGSEPAASDAQAIWVLAHASLTASEAGDRSTAQAVVRLSPELLLEFLRSVREHVGLTPEDGVSLKYVLPSKLSSQGQVRLWGIRLETGDAEVGSMAVGKLGALGGDEAISYLIRALKEKRTDPDWSVRLYTISVLGRLRILDAALQVIEYMDDPEPNIRKYSHDAIIRMTGRRFKFDPRGPIRERQATQRRYRQWFKNNETRLRRKLGQRK